MPGTCSRDTFAGNAASPSPSAARRIREIAHHIVEDCHAAVAGICWVVYKTDWYDTATIRPDQPIKTVMFPKGAKVRVLSQTPPELQSIRETLVRVQFPVKPVEVTLNGKQYELVIDENTSVPDGQGLLGVPHEVELPISYFTEDQGQRVHEGLRTLLVRARAKWYLVFCAWLMLGTPFFVTAIRWRNFMRWPQGIKMPLGKCLQLTFVGRKFYSILLPGITGGDLLRKCLTRRG